MHALIQRLFGLGKPRGKKSGERKPRRQQQQALRRLQVTCLRESLLLEKKSGSSPF
jgi:hypothetical protein